MEFNVQSMYGIDGKVVVVTGGCGGIGSGLARILSQMGARVAVLDLKQEACDAKAAEIAALTSNEVRGYAIDSTDEKNVIDVFDKICSDFGSIYGLVNCAGVTHVEFLRTMPIDKWQKVMDVNTKGTLLCDREAAKHMFKSRVGRIINISSLGSHVGKPGYAAYTTSKAAVDGLTITLAIEWGRRNVTVNAIAPVFVPGVMTRQQWGDRLDEMVAGFAESNPVGMVCSPEALSGLVGFLLSESAYFVNGQIIGCDGGASAGMFNPNFPQDVYEE